MTAVLRCSLRRPPSIVKSRISGKDATTIAREALKRRPIPLLASEGVEQPPGALVPSDGLEQERKTPPRVRKPSPLNDQCSYARLGEPPKTPAGSVRQHHVGRVRGRSLR